VANPDTPHGFEFVRDLVTGSSPNYLTYEPFVTAGTTVYRGQFVKINAAGQIAAISGTFANDSGILNGACVGVCAANRTGVGSTVTCPIILAKDAVFRVQADGSLGTTITALQVLIGNGDDRFNITNPNSGDALGNSIAELAVAGTGSAQYLQLVGVDSRPDNEYGANIKVHVRFDSRLFLASPLFITSA